MKWLLMPVLLCSLASSAFLETKELPTKQKLDDDLKKHAVQADFFKMKKGEVEKETKVYAEGAAASVDQEGIFALSVKEGTIYVENLTGLRMQPGDNVRVYGMYQGLRNGHPLIAAVLIEKL
ncbi:hypothetical protein [Bacillus glycinifermentans]|uniref:DNA-binding protein n=1 Tax=Bacillus glycinifermentans TaxID=1664069 RepID=A0A0T6BUM3_9BACI|nr:hypothetical protein [Bacillus glycinifermentans]ATH92566.1 hypothetical protein COP00_08015 [Bacillus glycinifermentans]KRT95315.1 hypothetical protein AB447_212545 [Bacillus glycinifermentans]MEC0486958.1 hypothetical protein [Bacillus glycinifermentans]MEC0493215.1 hypothetical protein [Bacillus glycinifermentans]MEC0542513.1 hypothetical protein [Bacillus glycinifermentans]